ncbi:hypothetical protein I3760_05G142600 [Carya illinoinensis]|nr:hypothetical protein I3760_05G142600 [Carya illinoinensis]
MAADPPPPPPPSSDAASPFFLHPSDNPGVVLVTQILLSDNYHTWSRSMTMALSAKNKLGFVDGQLTVSAYFIRLKALWDELLNYKPVPMCSCGAVTLLNSYVQQERILQFLMGLNESFASARAQILLMEPLPPLNKVFSLVLQEEQ